MSSTIFPDVVWRKSSHSNGQANCVEVAGVRTQDSRLSLYGTEGARRLA